MAAATNQCQLLKTEDPPEAEPDFARCFFPLLRRAGSLFRGMLSGTSAVSAGVERFRRCDTAEAAGDFFRPGEAARSDGTFTMQPHSRHLIFFPASSSFTRACQLHSEHATETAETASSCVSDVRLTTFALIQSL